MASWTNVPDEKVAPLPLNSLDSYVITSLLLQNLTKAAVVNPMLVHSIVVLDYSSRAGQAGGMVIKATWYTDKSRQSANFQIRPPEVSVPARTRSLTKTEFLGHRLSRCDHVLDGALPSSTECSSSVGVHMS